MATIVLREDGEENKPDPISRISDNKKLTRHAICFLDRIVRSKKPSHATVPLNFKGTILLTWERRKACA
jgi:hypothetical protein